ncbi:MAG: efflux RND transporter periplasmic adaptor subunit [Gudongella sp.]|nr:efflux RND transporter periplasmic adaptor subunit [Gudongella sp.]
MKKKWIIIGAIILVIAAGIFYLNNQPGLEVNVGVVERGNIEDYIEEIGTVTVRGGITVYAPVAAKVQNVFVEEGDIVNLGDMLVEFDKDQLALQIAQLDAQSSAVLAQLNDAKRSGNANQIKSVELDITDLNKSISEDEQDLEDLRALFEAGAISDGEYNNAKSLLDSKKISLEKLELQLLDLRSPSSQYIVDQFQAQINQIDLQKKELLNMGEDFILKADIAGTVLSKNIEKGSFLQAGMSILSIGDLEKLYIESELLVSDIVKIKEGALVKVSDEDLDLVDLEGTLTKIYPNAFSKVSDLGIEQKRVKADIEFKKMPENIRPGYELDIKIIQESKENTLIIPENAVFSMNDKEYIFRIIDSLAVLTAIEVGIESEKSIEVISGLEEGDTVILSPESELEDGDKVKIIE